MLIDLGFLEDKADGAFGSKTEAAVEEWQQYRRTEQTGEMTEAAMADLEETWGLVTDVATEANLTEEELINLFGEGCRSYTEKGVTHFEYCFRHYRAAGLANLLLTAGDMPETMRDKAAERLQQLWLRYIPELFGLWEASLPESQKYVPQQQREGFEFALESMRAEWKAETAFPLVEEALWLNEVGAGLCSDLYTGEGYAP